MDEDKKQKVKIVFVVACLVFAVAIYWLTKGMSSGPGRTKGTVQLLCANEECNAEYELAVQKMRETMVPSGPAAGTPGMGPQMFVCIECGENSAFRAMKCGQCGLVFTEVYDGSQDYADRCPECEYSAIEDRRSKRKK